MNHNLSPEEILRNKEEEGGIEFDPVPSPKIKEPPHLEGNDIGRMKESHSQVQAENPLEKRLREIEELKNPIGSLGKSSSHQDMSKTVDDGWKNLPLDILPSGGIFYPEGTRIAIRPADVKEIRHFSSVEEEDRISVNESLNYILSRCMRMIFPQDGIVTYQDIIQEDRFYIIMAIRDLTFLRGENVIILKPDKKCKGKPDCPFTDGIELRTGVLDTFEIEEKVLQYFDPSIRGFSFELKNKPGKILKMYVPTIGVTDSISDFLMEARKRKVQIGKDFIKVVPFLFPDWRNIGYDEIYSKMRESDYWTKEEFSLYYIMSEKIKIGTKLGAKVTCPICTEEVTAPILFKNGIKSLFVISDIFGELL